MFVAYPLLIGLYNINQFVSWLLILLELLRQTTDIDRYALCIVLCIKQMLQGQPILGDIYKAKALGSSKKRKMSRPRDWTCGSCQHLNFYWRQSCQRCQEARPEGAGGNLGGQTQVRTFSPSEPWVPNFRPGDWFCGIATCQAHNFSNRRFCFKCGVLKNVPSFGGNFRPLFPPRGMGAYARRGGRISRRGWKPGDWFCGRRECNAHNYGSRVKCFKCDSSRELVGNNVVGNNEST